MAQTGPDLPNASWKEAEGTCGTCGAKFSIGKMVNNGATDTVTDECYLEICDGSATVTLNGDPK